MRALVVVMTLGCSPAIVPDHPAVIPKLSEVPADKRGEVLDSSFARPTAEQRPATKRGRRVETLAAFAAAYVGSLFSKDDNVTFGAEWIDVKPQRKAKRGGDSDGDGSGSGDGKPTTPPPEAGDGAALVPWVRLK